MQHAPAASSGSNPKAPGSAGGYLPPTKPSHATIKPVLRICLAPAAAEVAIGPDNLQLLTFGRPPGTDHRSAILRIPSVRPGLFRASRIAFSNSGAIGGRPSPLVLGPL